MNVSKASRLYKYAEGHPWIKECYDLGDARRAGQTKHGFHEHALPVVAEATRIALIVRQHHPELIDDETLHVIIPFAALMHDLGGRWSIETHDVEGAKHAKPWLKALTLPNDNETLSDKQIARIVAIIMCHRAKRYLNCSVTDLALPIVLLADKSVGDEDRVRPGRAFILKLLTWFGLASIPLRRNGEHDRINFAMRSTKLHIGEDRVMELRMEIKDRVLWDLPLLFWLPKRKCPYALIFEHSYYKKNFHSMEVAARKLGYTFFLCFNGTRYAFNKDLKTWEPERK